jgi:hypothetical protein
MATREARINVEKGKGRARHAVTVSVPSDIKTKEFGLLHQFVIDKVIKDLTGCACLSGFADIIYRDEFVDVIRVDLKTGGAINQ